MMRNLIQIRLSKENTEECLRQPSRSWKWEKIFSQFQYQLECYQRYVYQIYNHYQIQKMNNMQPNLRHVPTGKYTNPKIKAKFIDIEDHHQLECRKCHQNVTSNYKNVDKRDAIYLHHYLECQTSKTLKGNLLDRKNTFVQKYCTKMEKERATAGAKGKDTQKQEVVGEEIQQVPAQQQEDHTHSDPEEGKSEDEAYNQIGDAQTVSTSKNTPTVYAVPYVRDFNAASSILKDDKSPPKNLTVSFGKECLDLMNGLDVDIDASSQQQDIFKKNCEDIKVKLTTFHNGLKAQLSKMNPQGRQYEKIEEEELDGQVEYESEEDEEHCLEQLMVHANNAPLVEVSQMMVQVRSRQIIKMEQIKIDQEIQRATQETLTANVLESDKFIKLFTEMRDKHAKQLKQVQIKHGLTQKQYLAEYDACEATFNMMNKRFKVVDQNEIDRARQMSQLSCQGAAPMLLPFDIAAMVAKSPCRDMLPEVVVAAQSVVQVVDPDGDGSKAIADQKKEIIVKCARQIHMDALYPLSVDDTPALDFIQPGISLELQRLLRVLDKVRTQKIKYTDSRLFLLLLKMQRASMSMKRLPEWHHFLYEHFNPATTIEEQEAIVEAELEGDQQSEEGSLMLGE